MKASKKANEHPNLRTYEALLTGYVIRADLDAAQALYRDLRHNGISPRPSFYHVLIQVLQTCS